MEKGRPYREILYRHPKVIRGVAENLIREAHTRGLLSDEDFQKASVQEAVDYLRTNPHRFQMVWDHRNDLLREATSHQRSGEVFKSLLFYALYFEHSANALLSHAAGRKGIRKRVIAQMLRVLPLEAKLSWALELLGLPPLNESHQKVIQSVAAERNAFVHYKYLDVDDLLGPVDQLDKLLVKARATVRYLRWFESIFLYRRAKKNPATSPTPPTTP